MQRIRVLVLLAAVWLVASPGLAVDRIDYSAVRATRRLPATRATGPIVIDGVLDEEAWRDAPRADGFIQNEPQEGEAASEPTEVRILYDDVNIYFGVFAHDL